MCLELDAIRLVSKFFRIVAVSKFSVCPWDPGCGPELSHYHCFLESVAGLPSLSSDQKQSPWENCACHPVPQASVVSCESSRYENSTQESAVALDLKLLAMFVSICHDCVSFCQCHGRCVIAEEVIWCGAEIVQRRYTDPSISLQDPRILFHALLEAIDSRLPPMFGRESAGFHLPFRIGTIDWIAENIK